MPAGHVLRGVLDHVHHHARRRARAHHPFLLRDVLLEDVVLDGPAQLFLRHALLLGYRDIGAEREDRAGVDGHAGGDAVERDPAEEDLEILQGGDGDSFLPHLAARHRMVGVVAHQGRHVEGRAQAGHAVLQQVFEPLVGVLRRSESGELAHGPQAPPVHARLRSPRVRELPRKPQVALVLLDVRVAGVAGVGRRQQVGDGDAGIGLEPGLAHRALLRRARQVRPAPLFLGCPEAVLGLHDREITWVWERRDLTGGWAYARRLHRTLAAADASP